MDKIMSLLILFGIPMGFCFTFCLYCKIKNKFLRNIDYRIRTITMDLERIDSHLSILGKDAQTLKNELSDINTSMKLSFECIANESAILRNQVKDLEKKLSKPAVKKTVSKKK